MKKATVHKLRALDFEFDIQKGIPIPVKKEGPDPKYRAVIGALGIGDSFYVPGIRRTPTMVLMEARALGFTLTSRKIGEGIRIWRTA